MYINIIFNKGSEKELILCTTFFTTIKGSFFNFFSRKYLDGSNILLFIYLLINYMSVPRGRFHVISRRQTKSTVTVR